MKKTIIVILCMMFLVLPLALGIQVNSSYIFDDFINYTNVSIAEGVVNGPVFYNRNQSNVLAKSDDLIFYTGFEKSGAILDWKKSRADALQGSLVSTPYRGKNAVMMDATSGRKDMDMRVSPADIVFSYDVKFYDFDSTDTSQYTSSQFWKTGGGGDTTHSGVNTGASTTNYYSYDNGNNVYATSRTTAWHNFTVINVGSTSSSFSDGVFENTGNWGAGCCTSARFALESSASATGIAYWDEIYLFNGSDKGFKDVSSFKSTTYKVLDTVTGITINANYSEVTGVANISCYVSADGTANPVIWEGISCDGSPLTLTTAGSDLAFNFTFYTSDENESAVLYDYRVDLDTTPALQIPTVTITYPSNGDTINNGTTYPLKINGTVTIVDASAVNTTIINDTRFKNEGSNSLFNFTLNGTLTNGEIVHLMVISNGSDGTTRNKTVFFTFDTQSPTIVSTLDGNSSFFDKNKNITFQINFTDNLQLYSFNITTPEGFLFNITGLNTISYIYNGSINVSAYTEGRRNLTAEVCDAHTANEIKVWKYEKNTDYKDIKFNFDDDYFTIRPLDKTLIEDVTTTKLKDRYTFTYKKNKLNKKDLQSFIVVSNHYIDIIGNKDGYYGWLVIPKLNKWIDFNLALPNLKYTITRINDNVVLIDIDGITTDEFTFNSAGDLNCRKETWYYNLFDYKATFEPNAVLLDEEKYSLEVNFEDIFLSVTGKLVLNNTIYDTTASSSSSQGNLTTNLTLAPSDNLTVTNNFFWNLTINGSNFITPTYSQDASSIRLQVCGNISNVTTYNFTLYDESNNSKINGNTDGTFNYLTSSTLDADRSNNNTLPICIFPFGASTTGDFTVLFSGTGYQQRRYVEPSVTYNNISVEVPLYLLKSVDGVFVRFNVVTSYQVPIPDVLSIMKKTIGGTLVTVERSETDDSGLVTFFVNPDDDYVFTFSKVGFLSQTFTLRPTTTDIITITLQEALAVQTKPFSAAVNYIFLPNPSTVLNNNTNYNFTFNLTSSYWNITSCKFMLKNETTTLSLPATTNNNSQCSGTVEFNTGLQDLIISNINYSLSNNINQTVSIEYKVIYTYTGTFSLQSVLDDVTNLSDAGFSDFTRGIIAFIIMFAIVGVASFKFVALREPESLIILTWALVFLFSIIGWLNVGLEMPNIRGLPVGWLNQYIIFILMTLGGGSYLINKHI